MSQSTRAACDNATVGAFSRFESDWVSSQSALAWGAVFAQPGLPSRLKSTLGALCLVLHEKFGERLKEVRLFGSWARGEQTMESDVDVLVVVDDLTPEERRAVRDLAWEVDSFRNEERLDISPLVDSSSQVQALRAGGRRLLRDIDREGIEIDGSFAEAS